MTASKSILSSSPTDSGAGDALVVSLESSFIICLNTSPMAWSNSVESFVGSLSVSKEATVCSTLEEDILVFSFGVVWDFDSCRSVTLDASMGVG
ncbi:Uncharacterised protein [Chlamydia trachomatis]|nr:Uncharacterised protein [Chlamydia trachomatis]